MHSSVEYVILNSELNRKQQVPAAGASSPAGRVKGKRVRVPRDLVTVIRESAALALSAGHWRLCLWEGGSGR